MGFLVQQDTPELCSFGPGVSLPHTERASRFQQNLKIIQNGTLKHIHVLNITAACLTGHIQHTSVLASIQILPELEIRNKKPRPHFYQLIEINQSKIDTLCDTCNSFPIKLAADIQFSKCFLYGYMLMTQLPQRISFHISMFLLEQYLIVQSHPIPNMLGTFRTAVLIRLVQSRYKQHRQIKHYYFHRWGNLMQMDQITCQRSHCVQQSQVFSLFLLVSPSSLPKLIFTCHREVRLPRLLCPVIFSLIGRELIAVQDSKLSCRL